MNKDPRIFIDHILIFGFWILIFGFFCSGCLTLDSSAKKDEVAQIRSSVSEELIKVKQEVNSLKGEMEELEYKMNRIRETQSQQSNELNATLREWKKDTLNNIEIKLQSLEKKQAQDKKELLERTNIISEEVSKENRELRRQIEGIARPAQEGYYIVSPGDTLSKVAQMYGVSLKGLMEVNGITDPNSIQSGQKLIIPEK